MRKKSKKKPRPSRAKPLEPWVIENVIAYTSRNGKKRFAGYATAYILSFLGVFQRKYGVFPTVQQIQQVFAYSQSNKPREQLRRLEDEGYVRLDASRCHVVAIIKAPYFIPRPDFAKEKINGFSRRIGLPPLPQEDSRGSSQGGDGA